MPPRIQLSPYKQFVEKWKNCTACHLCEGRQKVVLARGTYPCEVLFIAEAPGVAEDLLGRPMVGPAGHLMDHIIDYSVPKEVTYAITNLVCCIPRGEDGKKVQLPDADAIEACSVRLKEFVLICDPNLIICVGKQAEDWLDPGYRHSIKFHKRIPMARITHPAAILRANIAQQGLAIQKAIVMVRNAIEEHIRRDG